MSATRIEQLIAQKQKEIEEIRQNSYKQDIVDVLNNKKHTEEELAQVCKTFYGNYLRKIRVANVQKAIAERERLKTLSPEQRQKEEEKKAQASA